MRHLEFAKYISREVEATWRKNSHNLYLGILEPRNENTKQCMRRLTLHKGKQGVSKKLYADSHRRLGDT